MRAICMLSLAVLCGCGGSGERAQGPAPAEPRAEGRAEPSTSAGACRGASPEGGVQAQLEAVAACFHAAVLALGREPEEGEALAAFFGAAQLPGTPQLRIQDGAAIAFEVVAREHDDYDDGRSDFVTTYRFTAPGHAETAEITIVLSMGGGPTR
jgi:hypothetical protein